MIHHERIAALEHRGYPPRHAAFLELVMLHGGYFVCRQVTAFLGRRDGGVTSDFLWHLVRRHVVWAGVGRRRAHLYDVFRKPLYAAIGEAENRNRRTVMPPMVIRKLMTLDAVLGDPALTWLATEDEKIRPLTEVCHVPRSALPATWYPGRDPLVGTVRYFVDKAPIAVRADGEVTVAYVQGLDDSLVGLQGFLDRYVGVLSAVPKARVLWVVPHGAPIMRAIALVTAWRHRVESHRSRRATQLRDDLYAYCVCRHRLESGRSTNPDSDRRLVRERQRRVVGPRFPDVYEAFRASGMAAIEASVSAEHRLDVAHVRFSTSVLPYRYGLFGTAFVPASPSRHDAPIGEENRQ
jgi:hypothetical protein